ncbi:glutamate synthase large subunit [Thermithiobacillus plumbiphilus]|uniref:glutamate synthase large subunit n=1 Tax=Thermithiobacillus plumbiphilus TaxID=1729899 RepID=UPI003BF9865D
MNHSLYSPDFEKDSCGFGLIAQMDNQPNHGIVASAIGALACLTHRGAVAADLKTGDGCGLLAQMPDAFMRAVAGEQGWRLAERFGVGQFFLSRDADRAATCRAGITQEAQALGLDFVGWREVPTDGESACGAEALKSQPAVWQAFINASSAQDADAFERRLFVLRKRAERLCADDDYFFAVTCSSRVIGYKGLVMPAHLPDFYPDLRDERFASALVSYHQRFSTNTWPEWRLCQPFRVLAHNGELNTLQANRSWTRAREANLSSELFESMDDIRPIIQGGSDSFSLDNMLETLIMGGVDFFKAVRLLVPSAWQNMAQIDPELRAFYEYNSMRMEPWDGPAGLVFNAGDLAACVLDRNGLRPARYVITKDRIINIASEVGVFNYTHQDVLVKGRVGPGQMIAVNLKTGELLDSGQIDTQLKSSQPYRAWLDEYVVHLPADPEREEPASSLDADLLVYEKAFGVSIEERDAILRVLGEDGQEAVGSMGDDTPMAVLSTRSRHLADYFRQQFAQVTNPPIDPLREAIVMSLNTAFGAESNLFDERAEYARRIEVHSPVLSDSKFRELSSRPEPEFRAQQFKLDYASDGSLESAIRALVNDTVEAVRNGAVILVLSDRGIARDRLYIPAMMAVGAVHHALIDTGLRTRCNLIIETGSARDPHHFAGLIGYGATAVYPYLAYEIIREMAASRKFSQPVTADKALRNYRKGINKGLYKIMSKMGISTIASYRGSQLFEAIGLDAAVIDLCFKGTVSRLRGASFEDLESDVRLLLRDAFSRRKDQSAGGLLRFVYGGEYHAYNPDVVMALQHAVRTGDYNAYRSFADLVNNRGVATLRDLLQFKASTPIPIEEVEPVESITKRFDSAGMSLGALSPEAHEALAIAMNTIGGRSNSGEGGEDPVRYGTIKTSKIKQIASGRFGVTPEYLINAEELQIKIAQGAKPGEGGQLPGHKVNGLIARLRYAKPGVALISPPPHHDIYSIEDLAQLIFDLKQINPKAYVSVKLVAEAGVGTIAAGVAKAYADRITIAGYDGGTGASPLSSVKYAGSPWELGLAETHVTLRRNHLRHRVRLQTDGGLKTGLDVVKGAMLGAESFGFGTAPMIALGCKYLRICHLNNCATGVATQDEKLRKDHFLGLPEMVINYFQFVAQEVREIMASLGVRRFEELIGMTQMLEPVSGETQKQQRLDIRPLLANATMGADADGNVHTLDRNAPFDKGALAESMVEDAMPGIEQKVATRLHYRVNNTNRSIGTRVAGEIARRHGNTGMPEGTIVLDLAGTAGQSLGAFCIQGLHLHLSGDANDYVGKGMNGGQIVVASPEGVSYKSQESVIIGNTCLYGATGGKLYAAGMAGERFAVRNSGATAVVEGLGDHGCEYMTGGCVTVLGETGVNFGAGMTGGLAFVYDENNRFSDRINRELVEMHRVHIESMEGYATLLRRQIEAHVVATGSAHAKDLLDRWGEVVQDFWLVAPKAARLEVLLEEAS